MNQDPLIKDKVKGKVKLVYIDPPFATKSEFQAKDGAKSYSDKVDSAEFLEGLRERILYIRELISSDGSFLLHCDYRKGHYIKIILDEIFGEGNFRNEIFVRRTQKNLQQQFDKIKILNVAVDSVFWYSKRPEQRFPRIERSAYLDADTDNWHGLWKGVNRPTMRFELLGRKIESGQWMWSKDRSNKAVENYKKWEEKYSSIMSLYEYWVETGKKLEFIRANPSSTTPEYWVKPKDLVPADSKWLDIPAYGDQTYYPTCKSEALLNRIISHLTNEKDLVLDAFAGSGTTALAATRLGRSWIMCDFGKNAIYTMQKRILNIADSNKLNGNGKKKEKYRKELKPFDIISAGAYDFSKIMNLRENQEVYIPFVLGLFGIMRESADFSKKFKLPNIYAEKENNPVEVYPIWEDVYLKEIRIDEEYLQGIIDASGGKLKGDYYIVTPETCTIISDTVMKNSQKEDVTFHMLKFPYKVLEDVSRQFQIEEQPSSSDDINKLISSTGFYFNEEVKIKVQKEKNGLKIANFSTKILNAKKELFKGLDGLSMILIDNNYDGKVFNMDQAIYARDIAEDDLVKASGISDKSVIIAIDKHGNESKIIRI